MIGRWVALGLLLGLGACATPPPPSAFEEAYEDDARPWQEVQTQLPPAPSGSDLLFFAVSGATTYRFAVDAPSISLGTDGVFRYSLVAISSSGARNVSYEGIRCMTGEKKLYAIGRDDGTWVRARNAAWRPIVEVDNNRQQAALMKDVFCPEGIAVRNVSDAIGRLKLHSTGPIL